MLACELRGCIQKEYNAHLQGEPATVQLLRVHTKVPWQVTQGKGGNWVGICEPLKLTVQSQTWAELMEDIGLTLNGLMIDLLESNELSDFLRDQGWTLSGPVPHRQEDVRFDVPFIPAMMGANGPQREFHQ